MNDNIINELRDEVETTFKHLISEIDVDEGNYKICINHYENEAFMLRSYMSVIKDRDGEEVALSVDLKLRGGIYYIESDLTGFEGAVLMDGPSISFKEDVMKNITEWIKEFMSFVGDGETKKLLMNEIQKM